MAIPTEAEAKVDTRTVDSELEALDCGDGSIGVSRRVVGGVFLMRFTIGIFAHEKLNRLRATPSTPDTIVWRGEGSKRLYQHVCGGVGDVD